MKDTDKNQASDKEHTSDKPAPEPKGSAEIKGTREQVADTNEDWKTYIELKDVNGSSVAELTLKYDDQAVVSADGKRYRRLRKLSMRHPTTGFSINLFEVVGVNPNKIPVFVPSKRISVLNMYTKGQILLGSPIEDSADVLIFFHEAGHAKQEEDPALKRLFEIYMSAAWGMVATAENIRIIINDLPGASTILEQDKQLRETLEALETIDGEVHSLLRIQTDESRARFRDLQKLRLDKMKQVNDIILITIRYLEWDANERAFFTMQAVCEATKIDLTTNFRDGEKIIDPVDVLKKGILKRYFNPGTPYPKTIEDMVRTYKARPQNTDVA